LVLKPQLSLSSRFTTSTKLLWHQK
jgi:hypothetical protein